MATAIGPAMKNRDPLPPLIPVQYRTVRHEGTPKEQVLRDYFELSLDAALRSELSPSFTRFFGALADCYWKQMRKEYFSHG